MTVLPEELQKDYACFLTHYPGSALEDYRDYLNKANPDFAAQALEDYLKGLGYETSVTIEQQSIHIEAKDQGIKGLGFLTAHWRDLPMCYNIGTLDAVSLLAHTWYSYGQGRKRLLMTGYWEFPPVFEANRVLHGEQAVGVGVMRLRTRPEEILVTQPDQLLLEYGKAVENLKQSPLNAYGAYDGDLELFRQVTEVLDYGCDSTINKAIDKREFIKVITFD